jgi:hypothetical protein
LATAADGSGRVVVALTVSLFEVGMLANKKPPSAQPLYEGCASMPESSVSSDAPAEYYEHFAGVHSVRR